MSKIIEDVKNCVEPIIQSLNMELVDVEFKKQYGQDTLTIFIDKDGGVDLDACELVHNAIDAPLDELDPTSGKAYTLNVYSAYGHKYIGGSAQITSAGAVNITFNNACTNYSGIMLSSI